MNMFGVPKYTVNNGAEARACREVVTQLEDVDGHA
jgi:hypothetical protein